MESILLLIIFIILCVCAVILLILFTKSKNNTGFRMPVSLWKIFTREGMNIDENTPGSGKGKYFRGSDIGYGTFLFQKGEKTKKEILWRFVLTDLESKKSYRISFQHLLYVGRNPIGKENQRVMIPGDRTMSRTHCVVYESDGKLYVQNYSPHNVTYLNKEAVKNPVSLPEKAILTLGATNLQVSYDR